ncbi:poly(3-hydroxyalkanoate) depolymerase [Enemella dayhoffiae]|uniref:Poly(3-hydroxyalkanoate) depolymerase n=1 Tax=Enemella dayhoffiae TaxID=2016507 RepID=A0A255GZT4_9ACTN|nr:alpha/beta hydrolase [Enemella dayhoffiae]OYO20952.1 poly(3-hydroxyalkanoate) depolymerase [Enemella dayhoffiae]
MAATVAQVSDFGGRPIRWRENPGAGPAVVLVNGCGLASEHWSEVVRLLPGRQVVRFDRPGMGGTRWPETLPTLAEEVASLAELIAAVGAPALLVAHSMAAFHAEALARVHPELAAGLVLVDGSVEFLTRAPRQRGPALALGVRRLAAALPALHLGTLVHRVGATWQSYQRNLGHDWDDRFSQFYDDPDAVAMGAAESVAYWQQAWDLLQLRAERPLPEIPVLVLTAADPGGERDWLSRQRRLARLLEGRHLVVEHSRHLMMIDRPDAISDAVEALLR